MKKTETPTGLNEAQRRAVTHGEGPLLLLAGPGSGKTFTIANRILYLLERGEPPEGILVITFTREAALSMRRRFGELCGKISPPVNFGTFHSVFYHILRESGAVGAKGILGNSEKKALLLSILKQYSHRLQKEATARHKAGEGKNRSNESLAEGAVQEPGELLKEAAGQILAAISFYKNTMNLQEALKKTPPQWQPYFEALRTDYERRVREEGKTDFDDMLWECLRLFRENEEVRCRWQKRFSHILIDEFQDINPVQYEVLKLLTRPPYNLFAVGDDDQAIYGFRGAQPDCLRRFAEDFGAKRLLLDINYRSSPEIVRASLSVIGENKNRFPKELRAVSDNRGAEEDVCGDGRTSGVVRMGFEGREEQYLYLTDALDRALAGGETCAALFRTNFHMQSFAARLKRVGIPFEMKEAAVSVYDHFIVKDISAYLALSRGSADRGLFLRIVNKPSRYVSREAVAECGADFARLKDYYKREALSSARLAAVTERLAALQRQLQSMSGFSLRLGVEFCLKAVGYERYLRGLAGADADKWQEWQELLEWLKGDAAQYGSLREWLEAQEAYKEEQRRGKEPDKGDRGLSQRQNPVQLMTVHGAKGLEFDRVWIPDCNEKVFPHGSLLDERTVEEERRIFYVAMTRAKISLELLYLAGTEERPRQPSRFLNPLL